MLAYVYEGEKKLFLREVPDPVPDEDSCVIKVEACSICGTDLRAYLYGSKKIEYPRIIGHEVVGTIIDAGKKIKGFREGDRVAVAPAIGCGKCHLCINGHPNMCDNLKTIGFQYDGGFAQYMLIPAAALKMNNVNKLSDAIENEEAALAEPIACVINAQEFLKIKNGDYVAIFGSGFIGCIHAEIALKKGAEKVIMFEMNKSRAVAAMNLVDGIKMANSLEGNAIEEILDLTDGRGVDVSIVACSSGKAQEDSVKISAKRGRISLFGGLVGDAKGFLDSNEIHYKELSIFGAHASTPLQNKTAIDLISNGTLKVKKYVAKIFSLERIESAFEAIKNENLIKALIKP